MTGYIFTHEGQQFTPEGRAHVESVEEHNRHLEQAELAYWQSKPDCMIAYVTNKGVTTWLGSSLGRILSTSRFRNNLTGSRMDHVRVAGNNGATYHGTYGSDWRQCVRLRKSRGGAG